MKKIVWLFNETHPRGEYSPAVYWWYGILERLGYEVVYYPYESYNKDTFLQDMKNYKPDYIFHACYDTVHYEFAELLNFTKVYVLQSDDDWRFENFAIKWKEVVTGTISYQNSAKNYIQVGFQEDQIIEALWSFNPNTMLSPIQTKRDIFLSHVGGLHADRSLLLNQINTRGYKVAQYSNILYEQFKNILARSKFSLTFTKSSQGNFRQKKGRVAEIPFYTFMFTEPFEGLDKFYEPDRDIVVFSSINELVDKINYYSKNNKAYEDVLANGRERVLKSNTCYHSWNSIMSKIDDNYKEVNINTILNKFHKL